VSWVHAALDDLRNSGKVSGLLPWEEIEKSALDYVERKKKEGRWTAGWAGSVVVPTMDLLEGRELLR